MNHNNWGFHFFFPLFFGIFCPIAGLLFFTIAGHNSLLHNADSFQIVEVVAYILPDDFSFFYPFQKYPVKALALPQNGLWEESAFLIGIHDEIVNAVGEDFLDVFGDIRIGKEIVGDEVLPYLEFAYQNRYNDVSYSLICNKRFRTEPFPAEGVFIENNVLLM